MGVTTKRSAAELAFAEAWAFRTKWAEDPPPSFVEEYRFDTLRQWRFDFAWPLERVAVEINGRGRHQQVDGARRDSEKWNAATAAGWRIFHFPATDRAEAREWAALVHRGLSPLF